MRRSVAVGIARFFVGVLLLAAKCALAAGIPTVDVPRSEAVINLAPLMALDIAPLGEAPDPDALWGGSVKPVAQPPKQWDVDTGQRTVGRAMLRTGREVEPYVILIPSARMDEVRVWVRYTDSGPWKTAVAGDLVALSRWPFVGPMPAFPVLLDNRACRSDREPRQRWRAPTPVLLMPDAEYRKTHAHQASVSGFVAGLGIMVFVLCLVSAFTLARGAGLLLSFVALWALVFVLCLNRFDGAVVHAGVAALQRCEQACKLGDFERACVEHDGRRARHALFPAGHARQSPSQRRLRHWRMRSYRSRGCRTTGAASARSFGP